MNSFLKTFITVFLLVAIGFAFASASHAMSFDQHLITGSDPKEYSGCATPPTKTAFSPTDARVYSWLFTSDAFLLDVLTWKWYAPDNSLYVSYSYTPGVMGAACIWGFMDISGQPAASKTGTWKVEIYIGSLLAATDTFTIGKPLCTYSYSAWGPCQPDGIQERTITSSSPAGCIEWLPQLTQACTYVPPALSSPKNLRFTLNGSILTILWDAVSGASGYKLAFGTLSGKYDYISDLGKIVQMGPVDIGSLPPGKYTVFFAVKAYASGQESSYSNEIVVNITITGLNAPKNLRYSTQGNLMTIIWDAVSGASGYKIGIGTQSGSYSGISDLGKVTQIGPFDASGVASGTFYLAAKAYQNAVESDYSNEIVLPFTPPSYSLSVDQKNLIATSGKPQYLAIVFNSDPERREETWTYTALGKMYLFWDGVQVGVQNITIDPTLYAKPPSVDPSLFEKNTKPYHVIKIFGNDYTVTDASSLDSDFSTLDFKTYYFKVKGVFASFIGETLVAVQTDDIPSKDSAGIVKMGQEPTAWKNLDSYVPLEQNQAKLTTMQVITLAYLIGATAKGGRTLISTSLAQKLLNCVYKGPETCREALIEVKEIIGKDKLAETASLGFLVMIEGTNLIDLTETNCNANPSTLGSNELDQAGNGVVITCPCTAYTYSAWSACQPNGTRTRTVTSKSPAGCKGDPAPDLLSQSCPYTQPCTSFIYSAWSACQPNGTRTRTVISKSPSGCTGDPAPNLLTESCTYTVHCDFYTYSDWSACQPNGMQTRTVISKSPVDCTEVPASNLLTKTCTYTQPCTSYTYTDSACIPNSWDRRLGTITRTYKGLPNGCSGNVPPPEYFCCDGLDPC